MRSVKSKTPLESHMRVYHCESQVDLSDSLHCSNTWPMFFLQLPLTSSVGLEFSATFWSPLTNYDLKRLWISFIAIGRNVMKCVYPKSSKSYSPSPPIAQIPWTTCTSLLKTIHNSSISWYLKLLSRASSEAPSLETISLSSHSSLQVESWLI